MTAQEFHLLRPEWLWSLLPAALLLVLLWRQRGRGGGWSAVIDRELLGYLVGETATRRRVNLLPLLLAGWVAAAIAAAGPSWKKIPQPVHQAQDALVLVLDLSYSMLSADLSPSRIDRARQKLLDLLAQRREGQTGLIAYAGDAHIVTPLTDDNPTIANLLPALNPEMMPLPGSEPVPAIELALELLRSAGIRAGRILLVTDGVESGDLAALRERLADSSAELSVIGVGTPTGAPIPLPRGGFLKDSSGAIVMPALEEAPLGQLAAAGGGSYARIRLDSADIADLLQSRTALGDEDTVALDRTADAWEDQGYWLVLALLPLALGLFRRGWLLGLLPLLWLAQPPQASAQGWDSLWRTPDQRARRALAEGDAETAAKLFNDPDWAGTAAYRAGDYEGAVERFSGDSADAWYNRGNALARAGRLDEAIAAYDESLARDPDAEDAAANRALVEALRDQQQQQQQQQQQDQQSEDGEQDQQDQQGQQQNADSGDSQQDQSETGDDAEGGQENPSREQGQSGEEDQSGEQQESQQSEQTPAPQEPGDDEQQQAAAGARDAEQDQAMEQWLRRVPDDPSGLLREKFRYESRKRQRDGDRRVNEKPW